METEVEIEIEIEKKIDPEIEIEVEEEIEQIYKEEELRFVFQEYAHNETNKTSRNVGLQLCHVWK